jgi:hypothetical protein
MPFSGDTFTHNFDWEKDPQRQEKIVNARLEAEFDGIDTALSTVKATNTALAAPQYAVAAASADLANERVLTDTATVTWDFTVAGQAKANAASGAPTDASYLTLGTNGSLSAERVLTAGSGVAFTDAGANGALTVKTAAGTIIQVLQNAYTTNADLTDQIPSDDTTPVQASEGTAVLTQAITPASSSNKVLVDVHIFGSGSVNNTDIVAAIFRGSTCIQVAQTRAPTANFPVTLSTSFLDSPATTSSTTYTVNVGPVGAVTVRLNGNTTTRLFGGASSCTLTLKEIVA